MKLEIELDLNKIDYDAINQQIQQKIADLDLTKEYKIDVRIRQQIDEQINDAVKQNMYHDYWGSSVNDKMQDAITKEFQILLRETINPVIKEAFDKIPEEELLKMFIETFPVLYMNAIKEAIASNYYTDQHKTEHFVNDMITSRLLEYVHR